MKTAATAESPATRNLSQRLESLPFTRKHTKLLGVTGIGWALDAMDVGLISFIMAALTKQWALSPTETSWLGSIGFWVWLSVPPSAGFSPTVLGDATFSPQRCSSTVWRRAHPHSPVH